MTPITPDLHKQNVFKTQLPTKWMAPYEYLVRMSASKPEIAAFPTLFVAAFNGNADALKKVLELVFISHYAARNYAKTQEEISTANAIVFLGNQLAENYQREKQTSELETLAATIKPTVTTKAEPPAKQSSVDKQTKPDSKIQFTKPGTFRSAKKN